MLTETGGNPFELSPGNPVLTQANPPAFSLLNRLIQTAFLGTIDVELQRQNPESVVGRLFSEETGKFNSALENINLMASRGARAQQLWANLLQQVGA